MVLGGKNQCEMLQAELLGVFTMEISLAKGAPCKPDEGLREGLRFACPLKETSRQLPDSSAEESLLVGLNNSGRKLFP